MVFAQCGRGLAGLVLPYVTRQSSAGFNEGNLKWQALPRNKYALVQSSSPIGASTGLLNEECTLLTQLVFLEDAKATTIKGVTSAIKEFRETQPAPIADLMVVTDPPMRDPGNINLVFAPMWWMMACRRIGHYL